MGGDNENYGRVTEAIIGILEDTVGSANVLSDFTEIYPYAVDGSIFSAENIPEVVVRPGNTEEVSEIMKIANKYRIPVVPRGAGTGLAGGALAKGGGMVIDMRRFGKILEIDIDNQMVVVEAGVICDDLNSKLAEYGYFFPPDPGSSSSATIGGMVATNAGGVQAFKYGVTANYILWLKAVLPDGRITEFGSKTLKSTSSINFCGLMAGSEGTLAIFTEIGLRIRPLPAARKTGHYVFGKFEPIKEIVLNLRRTGIVPNMMEFLDRATAEVCYTYLGDEFLDYPTGYFFLLEIDGDDRDAIERAFSKADKICRAYKPLLARTSTDPQKREIIIGARKAALPALARLGPTTVIEDCTVNITVLDKVIYKIEELAAKYRNRGVKIATFGHLEGNLHPTFIFNGEKRQDLVEFGKAIDEMYYGIILPVGGTVTGEHGIGLMKTEYMKVEHGNNLFLMYNIKKSLDPNFILNPTKGKTGKPVRLQSPYNIDTREVLSPISCINCGFCVKNCPSFMYFGWEGYSPRGRISLIKGIMRGHIRPSDKFRNLLFACTLCNKCGTTCPAGVKTGEIFEGVRCLFGRYTVEPEIKRTEKFHK